MTKYDIVLRRLKRNKQIILSKDFYFKIKWGNKYIWPDFHYKECYYSQRDIPIIIKEIEDEYPRYKNKVVVFRMGLIKL